MAYSLGLLSNVIPGKSTFDSPGSTTRTRESAEVIPYQRFADGHRDLKRKKRRRKKRKEGSSSGRIITLPSMYRPHLCLHLGPGVALRCLLLCVIGTISVCIFVIKGTSRPFTDVFGVSPSIISLCCDRTLVTTAYLSLIHI